MRNVEFQMAGESFMFPTGYNIQKEKEGWGTWILKGIISPRDTCGMDCHAHLSLWLQNTWSPQ